ncbi:MAG: DUF1549 and DUF1553 domain-containing protein, partial [Gemmataceae bacterium]
MLAVLLLCAAPDAPVSFRADVMAVLSRAGCNSGPCHGNLNGKGGFKLSLRGESADADFLALTRDALGRRLAPLHAGDSLLLAKATMALPHEGGQRFSPSSPEAAILRRWIAAGAALDDAPGPVKLTVSPAAAVLHHPQDRVTLRVTAGFADGTTRDVTRLATFEPSTLTVRVAPSGEVTGEPGEAAVLVRYLDRQATARLAIVPPRPGFVWKEQPEVNYIDRHAHARLKALKTEPAPLCGDTVFLRRASLDACGILPSPADVRKFLADGRPDRRARLIDSLLARDEFADFWALKWADLLRNEEKVLDRHGVTVFHGWIRRAFIDKKPLNEMARELIAGRGSSYRHPAANYYRALRDPHTRAEATAQVFLGVRLQCAKCHNHPFDKWTQTDYHRFAASFARVQYHIVENNRRDKLDKHEFAGEQIVYQDRTGELKHPVSGDVLAPRFLGADAPAGGDRLAALADWVADPRNPLFARAQANRVWQHLVGRGLVDPLDDFRESNPAVSEELLDALAEDLREHRFDLRHLVRRVMNSRTYQRSATPTPTGRDDETGLASALIRPLQAEQLFDAMSAVVGTRPRFDGMPRGTRAGQMPGVVPAKKAGEGERFLAAFGKPARSLSCECERPDGSTMAQAFQMITGPTLGAMIEKEDNRIGKMIAAGASDAAVVEELYLTALARPPSDEERAAAAGLVARHGRRAGLEDVLW